MTFDGLFDGRSSVASVFAVTGAEFAGDTPATIAPIGTVGLEFTACDTAIAGLILDSGTEFTWNLGRLTQGVECSIESRVAQ